MSTDPRTKICLYRKFLTVTLVLICASLSSAQSTQDTSPDPAVRPAQDRGLEQLNMRGGDVAFPPISDSVVAATSRFREALLSEGVALRLVSMDTYAQNTLRAPVPAGEQVYVGQRGFGSAMLQPILTADLRQLHLENAQLFASGVWYWASWRPGGPKAFDLWSLYFYKEFGNDQVEMKAGYSTEELEFIGMQVGGSTANAVQGVYAVLPYEVGMAYFPLTAPLLNFKVRGPGSTYVKVGAQRSLDAAGGVATEARNHTGFRFAPKGDGLLAIGEAGYRRSSTATARQIWFRAGYMRNSTLYRNYADGKMEPGNDCGYALMDYQIRRSDAAHPERGLFTGASAMNVPSRFNAYDRYFEARLYQIGPFRSRPDDVASVVSSYTGHSRLFTDPLIASGTTVWRSGASLTGSYTVHLVRGVHVSLGLSYIHGPAIAPRVKDPLIFTAAYLVYF